MFGGHLRNRAFGRYPLQDFPKTHCLDRRDKYLLSVEWAERDPAFSFFPPILDAITLVLVAGAALPAPTATPGPPWRCLPPCMGHNDSSQATPHDCSTSCLCVWSGAHVQRSVHGPPAEGQRGWEWQQGMGQWLPETEHVIPRTQRLCLDVPRQVKRF